MANITGTDGIDVLIGTDGDDTILGLGGNDQINGGAGNDTIDGGAGNDIITGGPGIDTLTGGPGADTFRDTASGLNGDNITDLQPGDRIQITDLDSASASVTLNGSFLQYSDALGHSGSVQIDNVGPGRLVTRPISGGGVEIRLQEAAHNDFNGDGRSDVMLVHDSGTVIDWLGQSDGTFFSNHANTTYTLPAGWHASSTGDYNGDGRVDLLLRNDNGSITEWLGQANGGFSWNSAATYGLDNSWHVATTGDFNGDGRADVLLVNNNGSVTDWLGQADGTFFSNHQAASYALPSGWSVATSGDFNGDGIDDVLLRNTNGSITEWLGQSNGGFNWNSAATYGLDPSWHVAGTGDFNGDGHADVLLVNNNGSVTDWLGQAGGTFFSNYQAASYALPAGWSVAEIGDFNGDSRADVLLRNTDGSVTEWLGQAGGTFAWNSSASYGLDNTWHIQPHEALV